MDFITKTRHLVRLTLSVLLAIVGSAPACATGGTFSGGGSATDPYIIADTYDWDAFANYITTGNTAYITKCFKLADNFDNANSPVTVMVGDLDNPFLGVFDGNNRALAVNINGPQGSSDGDATTQGVAPFRKISGATIKNLTVQGYVNGQGYHAAGLVGICSGENTITNCKVYTQVAGTGYAGGIVGHGGGDKLTLTDSFFAGTITGFSNFGGGLVGWSDDIDVTITNCLFKGSYSASGQFHPIILSNVGSSCTASVSKTYYLHSYSSTVTSSYSNKLISGASGIAVSATQDDIWGKPVVAVDGITYYALGTEGTAIIGDLESTDTGYYLPLNTFYNYSLTQQLFTADEIGTAGTITSIAFYYTNTAAFTMEGVKVFMKNVDKESFESTTDMEAVSDDDLVFEGTFAASEGGWVTIDLDTPFEYDGTSNLLICCYDPTNGYPGSAFKFRTTTTDKYLALAYYQDNTIPDLNNITAYSGNKNRYTYRANIMIDITPEGGTIIEKPSTLTASDMTAHTVKLTWDGGTQLYNLEYKKKADEQWTSQLTNTTITEYTLSGLDANTAYLARIQSVGANYATSTWKTVSFTTTLVCPTPSGLKATLTPGDGTVATLQWTENGESTEWTIEYWAEGDTDHQQKVANTNPYTLTDLTPETTYYAKVAAWWGGEMGEWSETINFTPTDAYTLTVNDGTATNSCVPIYGTYVDEICKSQFIIPANVLEGILYGNITKLTFYSKNDNVNWAKTDGTLPQFKVYLSEVNESSFTDQTATLYDWETMDNVYEGSLAIVDNQMVIELDNTYQYMGGHLLVGIEETSTGKFVSVSWYGTNTESNSAIEGHKTSVSFQKFLPKTTIEYEPGETPACLRPTGLTVTEVGSNSATVSWTSNEPYFELLVNDDIIENVTSPYTLTGLEPATNYAVAVCARNESGTSDWTIPVSFITDFEEEKCLVTLLLTDSYGDGWNGNAIEVSDVLTGYIFAKATIEKLSNENTNKNATVDVYVPDGRDIQFKWISGSYASECSYTVLDVNEDEIFSGTGAMSEPVIYTVSCAITNVKRPTDVTVSQIAGRTAVVDWTENGEATEWVVAYWTEGEDTYSHQVNATEKPYKLTDLNPETSYYLAVRSVNDEDIIKWSTVQTFTTTVENPVATDIAILPLHNTATVIWTGDSESYDINYRLAASKEKLFFEDFENGLDDWTVYTEGGKPYEDGWYATDLTEVGNSLENHDGTGSAIAWSWKNGSAYDADNWLISPQVPLNGTLKFYVLSNYTFPDNYEVLCSTTGNAIADFTVTLQAMGTPTTGQWEEVSINLADFDELEQAGQGYIAIHHVQNDGYYLCIDDFAIFGDDIPAGEWQTVSTTQNSVEITGLEMDTEYEYQIIGYYNNTPNAGTEIDSFTTLGENDKLFLQDGLWNVAENWQPAGVPNEKQTAYIRANITIPSGVVAAPGKFITEGGTITIKDGAQLKTSTPIEVTVEKDIKAGRNYLLTTWLSDTHSASSVEGLLDGSYNFYSFDATQEDEWRNYDASNFNMSYTKGFFYANAAPTTLTFTGEILDNKASLYYASNTISYDENSEKDFNGCELIGNMYTCTGWACVFENNDITDATFYKLNEQGTGFDVYENFVELAPGEGALVQVYSTSCRVVMYPYLPEGITVEKSGTAGLPILPRLGKSTDQDASEGAVPTGITTVNAEDDGIWYSVDGKKLNVRPKAKGLYIKNGQKVVVK